MSWTIERGRVAVVTMTTNPVNAQNRAFFADLHEAFDRLERDHAESPVVLTGTGTRFSAVRSIVSSGAARVSFKIRASAAVAAARTPIVSLTIRGAAPWLRRISCRPRFPGPSR